VTTEVYCTILIRETRVGRWLAGVYTRMKTINPLHHEEPADDAAVRMIREKVARAYGEGAVEPNTVDKMAEVISEKTRELSKHQRYMQEISGAGKSLAEIQTAWHDYYSSLSNAEKHEVWQEFYAANQHTPYQKLFQKQMPVASRKKLGYAPESNQEESGMVLPAPNGRSTEVVTSPETIPANSSRQAKTKKPNPVGVLLRKTKLGDQIAGSEAFATTKQFGKTVSNIVSANGKISIRQQMQSLIFGLGMGGLVVIVLLFSFFNEFFITPFIQPSKKVTAAPVITSNMTAGSAAPTVIVSKINIQIPIDFTLTTNAEADIQKSLESGVIHYPSTVLPGQNGNSAYFGHSSSNIFNNGKYKFAFVLLHQLTTGDLFQIIHNGKVYTYQVFAKEIVPPTQVSILNDTKGKQATAVLVTCDPPGLSTNRLVVWGEQISPSPASNTAATPRTDMAPTEISSNGPTLWTRMMRNLQFWKKQE
jgi:LPXTG-site transpeptidase (sortase) family protein